MGNRANIVLVDQDGWQLRYSHWAGCRMLDALIAGPAMAERYVRALKDGEFWTSELWADGGLVLDLTQRRMLFFGEELMHSMNERRAIFEVLEILWPGYSISWAYDGTGDVAGYVEAEIHRYDKLFEPELTLAEDTDRLHHLVTVIGADGELRAWPLWWGSSAAWHGPNLLERLPGPGQHFLELGVLSESGVHVDVPDKTLGIWQTSPDPGLFSWLPQLWAGWRIERWDDRYEEQLLRCGPSITAPQLDIVAGLTEVETWLRKRVFQSHADSPQGAVGSLAALFGAEADGSQAMFQVGERPTTAEWARFEQACAQVRADTRAA